MRPLLLALSSCLMALHACSYEMVRYPAESIGQVPLAGVSRETAVDLLHEMQEKYVDSHKREGDCGVFGIDGYVDRGSVKTSLYEDTVYSVLYGTGGWHKSGEAYNIQLWTGGGDMLPGLSSCVLITPEPEEAGEILSALETLGVKPGEKASPLGSCLRDPTSAGCVGDPHGTNISNRDRPYQTGDRKLRSGTYDVGVESPTRR